VARLFDDANSEYISASISDVSMPITMGAWAKHDGNVSGLILGLLNAGADTDRFWLEMLWSGIMLSTAVVTDNVPTTHKSAAQLVTSGVWSHQLGVFKNLSSRTGYLNGVASAEHTATLNNDPIVNEVVIGRNNKATPNEYLSGSVAEAAIWDVELTQAEIDILVAGYSPLFVHPQNLIFYAPLVASPSRDTNNDVIGGLDLTGTAPENFNHPPIIYPSAQILQFPSGVAGGAINSKTLTDLIAASDKNFHEGVSGTIIEDVYRRRFPVTDTDEYPPGWS